MLEGVSIGVALTALVGAATFRVPAPAAVPADARRDRRAARLRPARDGRRERPGAAARGLAADDVDRRRRSRASSDLWFATFPTVEGLVAQAIAAALVHRLVLPRGARPRQRSEGARRAAGVGTARRPETAVAAAQGVGSAPEKAFGECSRRELDSRLLILVTLALVAFGLVMVYSATSAPAAVGGNNPNYYLERQGIYAVLGIVLMVLAQRWDYRRLRALAPMLVLVSLGLLVAVLAIGPPMNGARRWISFGPAVFQPSELAKLALAVWAASYLTPARRRARCASSGGPSALLAAVFAVLLVARAGPRHGDRARAHARRRCWSSAGRRSRVLATGGRDRGALGGARASGSSRTAARASSRSCTLARRAGNRASRSCRR